MGRLCALIAVVAALALTGSEAIAATRYAEPLGTDELRVEKALTIDGSSPTSPARSGTRRA